MEIYLLRHGIAETGTAPDAARALTEEGRRQLRAVFARARQAGTSPSLVLSSPLRRAVETAELAAEILGYRGRVVHTDALTPASAPERVWEEIASRAGESAILLAGHEPLMGQAASYFLGSSRPAVNFRPGALVRIDCERLSGEPRGVLQWMLTAETAG